MEQFTVLKAVAASLPLINIDTDVIAPTRFNKFVKRTGLGKVVFHALRYDESGAERPDFVLNKILYRNAKILITGVNFGCGSSREHAAWALADFGIRCVIASSFADIFYNNSFKNGILCITVPQMTVDHLAKLASTGDTAGREFTVDLERKTITGPDGSIVAFGIDSTRREKLLKGIDDIDATLQYTDQIKQFEERRQRDRPWQNREILL